MALYLLVALFHGQAYVLDSHLSREDCGASIAVGISAVMNADGSVFVIPDGAVFECVPEAAQATADVN